ncbi:uncharacterized protein LOC141616956 [Silene latifolia]|uniref:uncharacterized protein LOC141616956 n=1 Tax=Silene latifolia TaxID=37657 RepID=UPI003D77C9C2
MVPFQNCVLNCGLTDLKAVGSFFTWSNKQEMQTRVYSRIDRVLINDVWLNMHPGSFANFLPEIIYDHCPCVIQLDSNDRVRNVPFRYFNMWAKAPGFLEIVNQHWNVSMYDTHMYKLVTRMKAMKKDLKALNRDNFHDVEKNAHILQMTLQNIQKELQASPHDAELIEAEKSAALLVSKSWMKPCIFTWLKKVVQIEDEHGNTLNQLQDINDAFERYYINLLGINSSVKKIHGGVIGADVVAAVQDFFSSGKLLKQINNTTLTLIPKVDMPKNVNQFIPIACCTQFTNVLQRFYATDLVRKHCSPRVIMKLDLQKAYDSIEWSFLEDMLKALNFPTHFLNMLMECVTTPHFSLSLNGEQFRGDWDSMTVIMSALNTFSAASGLQMNKHKSNIYGNGLPRELLEKFAQLSGLKIVERIVDRIRALGAKKLSYVGRLVLIKSVLSTLHSHLARIYIIPTCIMAKIESTCKSFLWKGETSTESPALVAWDKSVGISTRGMAKKAAVNAAASSLRSAHVPTRPRKFSVASIAAAATALLAASSPSREEGRSVKADKKASPCKSKALPNKKETSTPSVASVMVISDDTLEDRM